MRIENFDPYDFQKIEQDGLTIYSKELPWSPCVHVSLSFRAGAFHDPVSKEGLAHFLEHIVFDGSPLLPSKKAVNDFERLFTLDSLNAYTNFYRTSYNARALPEHFREVFERIVDLTLRPLLDKNDIEHERKIITQEAWGKFKNEKYLSYIKRFMMNTFPSYIRSRVYSALGWPETIAAITYEDLISFHKTYYVRENTTLFLVGAIKKEDINTAIKFLDLIPHGEKSKIEFGTLNQPLSKHQEEYDSDIGVMREQAELALYSVRSATSEKQSFIATQASKLLQDLLHERLRTEHSLCYGLSVSVSAGKNIVDMAISVSTSEDKLNDAEREIWNVVTDIISDKAEERFETIHKLYIDQIRASEHLSGRIRDDAESDVQLFDRVITHKESIMYAEQVTHKEVREIISFIFDMEFVVTEIIRPSRK